MTTTLEFDGKPSDDEYCPTADDCYRALMRFLPRGTAWDNAEEVATEKTSNIRKIVSALGKGYWELDDAMCSALDEWFCVTSVDDKDGWERDYGIPDECDLYNMNVCAKVSFTGAPTAEYLIALLTANGYSGEGRWLTGDDPEFPGVYSTFHVEIDELLSPALTQGTDLPFPLGEGYSLGDPEFAQVECMLDKYIPAHCVVDVSIMVPKPPIVSTPPVISGIPTVGRTLSSSEGNWMGIITTLSYQWYRANASTGAGTAIAGATTSTYKLVTADVGKFIYCAVTAINDGGSTISESNRLGAVAQLWKPTDLGSKLKFWLNADTTADGFNATWVDSVGSLSLAAFGSPLPSSGIVDGFRWMNFDGIANYYRSTGLGLLPTGVNPSGLWCVVRFDTLVTDIIQRNFVGYGNNAGQQVRRIYRNTSSKMTVANIAAGANLTDTQSVTGVNIVHGIYDTVNNSGRINGRDFVPPFVAHGGAFSTPTISISVGAHNLTTPTNFLLGGIRHVCGTDGTTTTDEKFRMDGFFAWDVERSDLLPVGHPYKSAPPTI